MLVVLEQPMSPSLPSALVLVCLLLLRYCMKTVPVLAPPLPQPISNQDHGIRLPKV